MDRAEIILGSFKIKMGSLLYSTRINAEDWINSDYGELDSNTANAAWDNINTGDYSGSGPTLFQIIMGVAESSFVIDKIRIRLRKTAAETGTIRLDIGGLYAEINIADLEENFTWITLEGSDLKGTRTMPAGYLYLTLYSPEGGIFWVDYVSTAGLGSSTTFWETNIKIAQVGDYENFTAASAIQCELYGGTWDISLCTFDEYLRKVGVNASTESKEVEFARDACKQAECTLNARTKKNWSNIYSTISEDLKEILNRIVSNIAAMEGINADMSGFTSRLEATSMIDYLRWGTEKLINELKKDDLKNFIESG